MAATIGRISAKELKQMRDGRQDMLLVNVLPDEMFASGHIPGSENIQSGDAHFVHDVERLAGNKDRHIVVYCGGGSESSDAARELVDAGFTSVDHFAGGMAEWKQFGYAVERGAHARY